MGYEKTRFIGKVDQDLICPICLDVLEDPVQTPYGHPFCKKCLIEWLPRMAAVCPELAATDVKTTSMLNRLNKMQIKCDFQLQGCTCVIMLEHLKYHLSSCEYNPDVKIVGYNVSKSVIRRKEQIEAVSQQIKWRRVESINVSSTQPNFLKGVHYAGIAQFFYHLSPSKPSFKIEILKKNVSYGIGIGLSSSHSSAACITYYSDGELNCQKVPILRATDIIECRINFDNNDVDDSYVEVEFLRNEESLAKDLVLMPYDGLYPSIWLNSHSDTIKFLID